MKLKKNISKLLFYSILFNSIPFYSNAASNSTLSRYETLEGEFIDLGDTDSKDISEIEIFGNTVQDPNNLEDIQSVGELYVNKEGEPILDSQGRKQYKIEIESCNGGSIQVVSEYESYAENYYYKKRADKTKGYVILPKSMPNTTYSIKFTMKKQYNGTQYVRVYEVLNGEILKEHEITGPTSGGVWEGVINGSFTTSNTSCKLVLGVNTSNDLTFYLKDDINISIGNKIINNKESNKKTILLPCQLMKIGNIADRLYWDKEKCKYVVEKNVGTPNVNDIIFLNYTFSLKDDNAKCYAASVSANSANISTKCNYIILNNRYYSSSIDNIANGIDAGFGVRNAATYMSVPRNELETLDFEGLNKWWKDNKDTINMYTILNTPQLIDTNITKKIQLKTYPEKTYVSTVSENRVNPTLKIYIDKLEDVSEEAVENAISSPTSNNIALARMFINMLPESLYKDQLQAKLNEIFSEDMVLDRLTATANLDVYIQSENILMMSLDTNTVTFEDYSGVEELELNNAIGISINSSLPYQLNAYIVGEIANKDKNKILDLDVLNIKDGSEVEYKQFDSINSKLVLLDNISKGNDISHSIDLKLSGNKAHDADVYKTTIKFEAEQK